MCTPKLCLVVGVARLQTCWRQVFPTPGGMAHFALREATGVAVAAKPMSSAGSLQACILPIAVYNQRGKE